MANFEITISMPVEVKQRVIDGVAYANGYSDQIRVTNPETGEIMIVANPVTKAQFAHQKLREWIKKCVLAHEAKQANIAVQNSVNTEIDLGTGN